MSLYARCVRLACRKLTPLTERLGFALVPIHFYCPVPSIQSLRARKVWDHRTAMAGVAWDLEGQMKILEPLAAYGNECSWPRMSDAQRGEYAFDAPSFGFLSACFAHAFVRHFKPRRIIEVGCGWSTLALQEAAGRNRKQDGIQCRYIGIDPYPPEWLGRALEFGRLVRKPVEGIPLEVFEQLEENDLLFIDSSHVLNIGGDVAFLYTEVLPRLRPGVVVHIHDIQFPGEYPREYAVDRQWFWNEQYLLQAFLAHNEVFEVLAGCHALSREHPAFLAGLFPGYDPAVHGESGSFWMRRKSARVR